MGLFAFTFFQLSIQQQFNQWFRVLCMMMGYVHIFMTIGTALVTTEAFLSKILFTEVLVFVVWMAFTVTLLWGQALLETLRT